MAIYRAETKHVTRSKNHNVVAAAAYRAGEKLADKNKFNPDAKIHDYSKKKGVISSGIILPDNLKEKSFEIDRQTLWSSVEESETTTRSVRGSRLKQSARLAREWLVSLPAELSHEENEELSIEISQYLSNSLGVITDYALHKPVPRPTKKDYIEEFDPETGRIEKFRVYDIEPSEPDPRNIHVHILMTTRKTDLTADGSLKFGEKADSERSEKWRKEQGLTNGGDYLKEVREKIAEMINKRLESRDIATITHKSYKDQGLNTKPQVKKGKNAHALSLYGTKTRIDKHNEEIKKYNDLLNSISPSPSPSRSIGYDEDDDPDLYAMYHELPFEDLEPLPERTYRIINKEENKNTEVKKEEPKATVSIDDKRIEQLQKQMNIKEEVINIDTSNENNKEESNENEYRPRPRF